jgi:hypothetical protein
MTTPCVEVAVAPARAEGGRYRRSAEVRSPRLGTCELWYEVDEAHADAVTDRADPFVVATLIHAMGEGRDLVVRGAAFDAGLVHNLREFQLIWNAWYDLAVVDIHGEAAPSTTPPAAAVVAFSGGADSAFSAWWHTRGDGVGDPPLRTAMTMRGIDVPLSEPEGFARAAARARRMTDDLGLEQVVVSTNAWSLPVPIDEYTGMGVSAGLHVLGGTHTAGYLPSTATYRDLVVPLNSSPVSDGLLSSSVFAIVHDGARYNRLEKLRMLADWPEAMDALRICLVDPRHDRNCGECNKCMLTLTAFRVIGVEPACFDRIPSADELRRWARTLPTMDYYLQEGGFLVDAATEQGIREPWVAALRNRIRRAHLKNGVRNAFPEFADAVATAHRRANRVRRALPSRALRR